jgi:hypothetical protein
MQTMAEPNRVSRIVVETELPGKIVPAFEVSHFPGLV